jgi:hypothetical protein
LLLTASSLLLVSACAGPEVRIQSAASELAPQPESPETIVFHADIVTRGHAGEQLVLEVTLLDRNGRPVRSNDGRYENHLGHVAAGRTLMIWSDAESLVRKRVVLPLSEVPMPKGQWPPLACYRVTNGQRRLLAEARKVLVQPPKDLAAAAPEDRPTGGSPSVAPAPDEGRETTTTQPVKAARWTALIRQVRASIVRFLDLLQAQMPTAPAQHPKGPAAHERGG